MILQHGDKTPRIASDAFVASSAMVIGNVEIGALANIWFGSVLRGDGDLLRIGECTNIQDGVVIHVNPVLPAGSRFAYGMTATTIGAGVTVGHMAVLHACTLEDGCLVGMKACVMDGAVVESEAMVAAGALVTPGRRVARGELWGGSPAKLLRKLKQDEIDFMKFSADLYVDLAASYRTRGSVPA
jgi:carbonic anhydrase/acetyltransferase-like protein (isoleucine patch superfamily)